MQRAKVREEKARKAQEREKPVRLLDFQHGFDKSLTPGVRGSVSNPGPGSKSSRSSKVTQYS